MFFFDPLYMLVMLMSLALSGWATMRVKSAFAKYSRVRGASGYTGADVARAILDRNGLSDVAVRAVEPSWMMMGDGMLTDHYDPRTRTVNLSPQVFGQASVAAQAIAAHEVGHALQHAASYAPLALRNAIVPLANFGNQFSYILIFAGMIIHTFALVKIGLLLFGMAVVFSLITLPVEIDASNRAKAILPQMGLVSASDGDGVHAVLNAAAWTYVAAAAAAVLNLLYLLLRTGVLGGRRDE